MRALPFLAALLCTAPMANAKSELELLQSRCAEMERQIRVLETENSQLKSQASLSTKTVIETAKPAPAPASEAPAPAAKTPAAKTSDVAPAPKAAGPSYATVRTGDTLAAVAKRNGTSSATLIKLNKLKNPSLIRPGQKLRLPDKAPAAIAKAKTASPAPSAPAPAPHGGTHIVKSGETFYSIARHYGLSSEALQAANPQIKSDKMRAGQTLHLGAKPEPTSTASSRKPTSEASPAPAPAPKMAATASTEQTAPESASQPVSNVPKLRLIVVNDPIDFGAFAAAHGTSPAKLNALNGHNLNPSTVLAKGSEFYVPAQP
ncbi:LysM peptidoglycan-binding domain-containing protein [Luteolibacter arcticus]|uniref:LysM peptidoglycan-binding domain-containing protein n=1 Tax=Luteolibacter arcticus TaxID=1581411 RepID=A0ABT3GBJ3_9BACT|nr:LysM domain-containing protein [Luteolibacter arcticus]MCW1920996.1 LysM peptidoglycan-binding domain-containing protein [Luteolibacter arcticus]